MRRPLLALLGGAATLALLAAVPAAQAAPAGPDAPSGRVAPALLDPARPFAASALASLLTVDVEALSPALLPQTNIDLAPSEAGADSDGDLDPDQGSAQRTFAEGGVTFGSNLLGAPLDVQSNSASAPADEVNEATLIPIDVLPLLDLPLIQSRAAASWASDLECVAADEPLSEADQTAADVTLLAPEDGQSVLALNTAEGEGAVDTRVATYLVSIPGEGDPRAVQARATTEISSAQLLNGFLGEGVSAIEVDVVEAPDYVVQASGLPGGASVTGDRPVVEVTINGDDLITLDDGNQTEDATLTDLVLGDLVDVDDPGLLTDLLADLGLADLAALTELLDGTLGDTLGALQPVVRLSIPYEEDIAADGTHASVSGAILRVEVLPPDASGLSEPLADALATVLASLGLDTTEPLVDVQLAPVSASVDAPAGGIDCSSPEEPTDDPLRELNKHASAAEVAPGGVFDYSISVPNRGPCTVTDVVVVDEITGPGFEVIGTEPEATVDGGTVTFDVGDLAPNETAELTITVRVADDAPDGATFDDLVTATGDCDGEPVEEQDPLDDVPTVRRDFTGPCSVEFSNKGASHIEVTPGQTFAYYVHAFNSGAEACTDVQVDDVLDERVEFVSCNRDCTHADGVVSWTIDEIPGGSSVVLTVVVQVDDDAEGTLANVADITPGNGPGVTVDHSGPAITDRSVPTDPVSPSRILDGGAGPLPRTGAGIPVALATALGLAGLALHQLRRRATPAS